MPCAARIDRTIDLKLEGQEKRLRRFLVVGNHEDKGFEGAKRVEH